LSLQSSETKTPNPVLKKFRPILLTKLCFANTSYQKNHLGKKAYDRILKTIPIGNPIKKGRYLYVFFYCTWGQAPIGCTNLLVLNRQIFFAA
jgi:hypothetical protein